MAVRSIGLARNVGNGVLGLDATGRAPLATLQIRMAQVTRAARPVLVAAGGSFSDFLASQAGDADATDGSWEACRTEPFPPPGGLLGAALSRYLQSLGVSPTAAATQVAAIWVAASSIAP